MIDASSSVFPNNAVDLMSTRLSTQGVIDPEPDPNLRVQVYKRPLRPTDATQAIGIAPMNWSPNEDSFELLGGPTPMPSYPTLGRYWINIQCLVKDGDQTTGQAVHSVLSTRVRGILYRDMPLRVGLTALAVDLGGGKIERYKRSGVRLQRYLANEVNGSFVYLSTIEFWIETETT